MKKVVLSSMFICFSLFGKTNIIDVFNNIPHKPNANAISSLPVLDNVNKPDIAAIPNLTKNSPVLVVINAVPGAIETVESIINKALNKNGIKDKISCYKQTTDSKTYFIFVPTTVYKSYLTETYEAVMNLFAAISAKLQECFAKNDSNDANENTVIYETSAANLIENNN